MGKILTGKVCTRFDGGASKDGRSGDPSKYSITKHFDAFSFPKRLVPHYLTEADETKNLQIVKFAYAPFSGGASGYGLYGYGVDPGTTKAAVYVYDIDAGLPQSWTSPASNLGTVTARNEDVFFYYKSYLYMWVGGAKLSRFNVASPAFTDEYKPITYSNNVAQPVHHPSDDIAYFFSDNNVHTLNDTTWTTNALILPTNLKITACCPYGNYLAIGCTTLGQSDVSSIVYLWDRDSSISTLSERIDFGSGALKHLANLNNKLIGVMDVYTAYDQALRRGRVVIKQANGTYANVLNEIITDNVSSMGNGNDGRPPITRIIRDNKLYFPMKAVLKGDNRLGIWVVDEFGRATIEFVEEEATSIYNGIFQTGNIWWIAHSNDGSVNRSDNNLAYSATNPSVFESEVLNGGNSSQNKKLLSITVPYEALPTAGQVTCKYRKDGDTSWTTIFVDSEDGSTSHTAVNIEATEANLPQFKEIEFRIESIGGAVLLPEALYKYEEIGDNPDN